MYLHWENLGLKTNCQEISIMVRRKITSEGNRDSNGQPILLAGWLSPVRYPKPFTGGEEQIMRYKYPIGIYDQNIEKVQLIFDWVTKQFLKNKDSNSHFLEAFA